MYWKAGDNAPGQSWEVRNRTIKLLLIVEPGVRNVVQAIRSVSTLKWICRIPIPSTECVILSKLVRTLLFFFVYTFQKSHKFFKKLGLLFELINAYMGERLSNFIMTRLSGHKVRSRNAHLEHVSTRS